MYQIQRFKEALIYFELANAIIDCHLGPQHERTLLTQRNFTNAKKISSNMPPEFQTLWTTAVLNPYPEKKKKKKKGKKKK